VSVPGGKKKRNCKGTKNARKLEKAAAAREGGEGYIRLKKEASAKPRNCAFLPEKTGDEKSPAVEARKKKNKLVKR